MFAKCASEKERDKNGERRLRKAAEEEEKEGGEGEIRRKGTRTRKNNYFLQHLLSIAF